MKTEAFERLWTELFTTPVHLDSALSKLPRTQKTAIAQAIGPILLRPVSTAERCGVGAAPGEPWSLAPEELARWSSARSMAERLMSTGSRATAVPIREDFPPAMVEEWERDWGAEAARRLIVTLGMEPPIGLRIKRSLSREKLVKELASEIPVRIRPSGLAPLGAQIESYAPILHTAAAERADFEIQDEGSQLMALFALAPEAVAPLLTRVPGPVTEPKAPLQVPDFAPLNVIDACAGAGGKTLAMADLLGNRGRIYSYDTAPRKLQALRRRAKRAGISNFQAVALTEGREGETVRRFRRRADVVLVDAPCTGWGVLRRNPDIKWRQASDELKRMPEIQSRLLSLYSDLVEPGGRLVFGLCTFRKAESVDVVETFLANHKDFTAGPGGFLGPGPCDGFFMQAFTRTKS